MNIVITNGENAAEGKEITQKLNKEFMRMVVNFLIKRLINYYKIRLIQQYLQIFYHIYKNGSMTTQDYKSDNILGSVYMNLLLDCPFRKAKKIIGEVKSDYYIVES